MLANVDNTYKWLWGICYLFGLAMVFSGFVMLYFNWSCRHNYLLLLPIVSYLLGSGIIWLHFWKSCKSHCKAIEIASGKKATSDKQEVDKMAKGIEAELQPTGETVNDASSPKTTKKKSRPL